MPSVERMSHCWTSSFCSMLCAVVHPQALGAFFNIGKSVYLVFLKQTLS